MMRRATKPSYLLSLALLATLSGQARARAADADAAEPSATPTAEPAAPFPAEPAAAATATPAAPTAEPATTSAATPDSATQQAAESAEPASTDALLAELEQEQPGAADGLLTGEALKLYGFGDVGYRHMLVPDDSPWLIYLNRHPSLFVGHLNFYFDSQLAERWRALAEVRFTYLPQGGWRSDPDGAVNYGDTSTADYADFTRDRPVGGLMIERAFIEYSAFSFLSLQAGQFLTPYGVWNVDHGSPVIIGVTPPFIIGARLLPESQVGLLAYGRVGLIDALELSYAAAVSNGRTDLIAYEDLDDDKALTARLALTYRGFGELTLGSTLYTGTITDNSRSVYFEGTEPKSRENIRFKLRELSYAFDVRLISGDFQLQAEAIVNDRKYSKRPAEGGALEPDRRNAGGYALLGYRTPLLGIMPYVKGEYTADPALQKIGVEEKVALFTGGLNFRPVPRVVFKGEYTHGFFPDAKPNTFASNALSGLDFQVAWAF